MEYENYWQRAYPNSPVDCFFWYWGSERVPPNTCTHHDHDKQPCNGKCKDYKNTHTEVLKTLKATLELSST